MRCSPTLSATPLVGPATLTDPTGFGAPSVTVRGDGELRSDGARDALARLARGAGATAVISGAAFGKHRAQSPPSSPWIHSSLKRKKPFVSWPPPLQDPCSKTTYQRYGGFGPNGDRSGQLAGSTARPAASGTCSRWPDPTHSVASRPQRNTMGSTRRAGKVRGYGTPHRSVVRARWPTKAGQESSGV